MKYFQKFSPECPFKTLQLQSINLEVREAKDETKLDAIKQYGRRQNLEIIGVHYKSGENTNNIRSGQNDRC